MSSYVLKWIACLSMLIDHTAVVFRPVLPDALYFVMRICGRTAFVIFCFFIVQGFLHTHNRARYALRLGVFALISEIPFDMIHGSWFTLSYQNVFFTLLLGLLTLWGIDWLKNKNLSYLAFVPVAVAALAAQWIHVDYGAMGVGLIVVIYVLRENRMAQSLGVGAVTLGMMVRSFWIQGFAMIGWLLCLGYNGKRGRPMRYVFYVFYPAHLLVLWLVRLITA